MRLSGKERGSNQSGFAVWGKMTQVDSWVCDCRVIEVIGTTFYKEDLEIWIRFCQSTGCYASSRSTAREYDVNIAN